MKVKTFSIMFAILAGFLLSSCTPVINPLKSNESPELFPIDQNGKWGYINRKGEVVIQPQFSEAWFFSEGLAVACIEYRSKCGYIDENGRFAINPQFENPSRFAEGLAAVEVGGKLGYIDKTGKFAINPQFESTGRNLPDTFSEGLASVKLADKYGFIDKTGRIIINPQFDEVLPFTEGLAAVKMGGKQGFVDKEGKIVVNPQFEQATPFINGLAAVQIGKQYGYIDKMGKIIINPQFDDALPFSDEGLATVMTGDKVGFVDKEGKYVINPQFDSDNFHRRMELAAFFFPIKELGRASFSEGLTPIKIGNSVGYIDKTGKIVINPQFGDAFPFYGGLAWVLFNSNSEMAWIDKEGKTVWRETKETSNKYSNSSISNSSSTYNVNSNSIYNETVPDSNVAVIVNSNSNTSYNSNMMMPEYSNNSTYSERTGRLTTDSNIRSEPNKDAMSLGIHFKDAKVKVLAETSYVINGLVSTWLKIRVIEYGCSKNTNLGCGKNSPNDSDEGWVNAKAVLLN